MFEFWNGLCLTGSCVTTKLDILCFAETDDLSYEDLVKLRVVSDQYITSLIKSLAQFFKTSSAT